MSDIENGNRLPSATTRILLADVLKCTTDWILTGKPPAKESSRAYLKIKNCTKNIKNVRNNGMRIIGNL